MAGKYCCGGRSGGGSTFTCSALEGCSITHLGDVDTTTAPPGTGSTLVWDGTNWIPGTGGGSGLTAVATQDTPTVDLSGNGTSGSPITATAIVAPEPNGLEAAANGLLVAPSSDAGNTLTVGTDGRLYASGGDVTHVQGNPGTAPSAVGSGRSVDVGVVEAPAGVFTVAAQISPAWADDVQTFTAPEAGVYEIQQTGSIRVQTTGSAAGTSSASIDADHRLLVNGTPVKVQALMVWAYEAQDVNGTTTLTMGPNENSNTITKRMFLDTGDVVTGDQVYNGIPLNIGVSQPYQYELSIHKISD